MVLGGDMSSVALRYISQFVLPLGVLLSGQTTVSGEDRLRIVASPPQVDATTARPAIGAISAAEPTPVGVTAG
jgi:hypothetical protein